MITASDPQGYALTIGGDLAGEPFFCSSASCPLPLPEGSGTVTYTAIASTSGLTASGSADWKRDSQAPQVNGSLNGTPGDGGWYISEVTLSASAVDPTPGSGLLVFEYALNGGGWDVYTTAISLQDGEHTVGLRASDTAGNVTNLSQPVRVDTQAPVVSLEAPAASFCPGCGGKLQVQYNASDGTSGIASWELTADSVLLTWGNGAVNDGYEWNGSPLGVGMHILTFMAFDAAGNYSEASIPVQIQSPPAPADEQDEWSGPLLPNSNPIVMVEVTSMPTRTPLLARTPVAAVFSSPLPVAQSEPAAPSGFDASGIIWGAAAAAALAAALVQAGKDREENQPRVTQTVTKYTKQLPLSPEVLARIQAAQAAQARGETGDDPTPPNMPAGLPPEAQAAFRYGGASAQQWVVKNADQLISEHQAQLARAVCPVYPTGSSMSTPAVGSNNTSDWGRYLADLAAENGDRVVSAVRGTQAALATRHLQQTALASGLVSVSSSSAPGTRLDFFDDLRNVQGYPLHPGAYKPATIATATQQGLVTGALSRTSIFTAGGVSLAVNSWNYGKDATSPQDFVDKTFKNQEFWVSTAVDFSLSVVTGVAGALVVGGLVAGAIALGATVAAPVILAAAVTAGVAIILGHILDKTGVTDTLKTNINMGIDIVQSWFGG